jgi:hypothetical protein
VENQGAFISRLNATPVLNGCFLCLRGFVKSWPDVDVDIRPGLAFDALPALEKEDVDLVVSSDP